MTDPNCLGPIDDHEPPREAAQPVDQGLLVIDSTSLFRGRREVWIQHGAEMYRLRLTSSGKIYLSK